MAITTKPVELNKSAVITVTWLWVLRICFGVSASN